ncbi:Zinc finger CCHC-type protein [Dioscorea alata]|uniref:Zinc finger CCHC-type protein n=1 Tax=Dioscorea alata TaxID=55571 RepID=A0ACB7V0L8_DIOAL|nr:Zinc finger CCHC-type protein [Dioscorea alata]
MRFLGGDREPHGGSRRPYGGGRGGRRFGARKDSRPFSPHHSRSLKETSPINPSSSLENAQNPKKNSPVKDGVSFAEVVRSSPPTAVVPTSSGCSSLKRHRSPELEVTCKRCLRPGHAVEDCRHQLTCRRCNGVGHFAARCPLKYSNPKSSEKPGPRKAKTPQFTPKPLLHIPVPRPNPETRSLRVSLPITEAIIQSKEDLRRRVIIKVTAGNASVRSLHAALPKRLKTDQCENITPFGDDFILTLFSAQAASAIVKLNSLSLETSHGPCSIKFSLWTPEFGSHAVAAGIYNWIRLTNLPLHCWNWDSIVAVLKPLGDLIFVRKCEDVSLEHMKALVRLNSPTSFPIDLTVDVGVRSFKVRLEDDGSHVIRSKIIHGPVAASNSLKTSPALPSQPPPASSGNPLRFTREEKGKAPLPSTRSVESSDFAVASHSDPVISRKAAISNSDDQPLDKVGRSSDDQRAVIPRIPPISGARIGEGDSLCMHSDDVSAERTTSVDLPRDQLAADSFGPLQLSSLPRDMDPDSSNNSNLISSRSEEINLEKLHRDEAIPDQPYFPSSDDPAMPRDSLRLETPIKPSFNALLPRDGISNLIAQADHTQSVSTLSGSTMPNPLHANLIHPNSENCKNIILASNINSLTSSGIKLSTTVNENSLSSQSNSLEKDDLPTHLRLLPPTIPIPEGYKWIFIHGGWTLVPSINSDKFFSQDPTPPSTPLEVPSDEELVDWGEDEEFPTDEITEDDHFLSEENLPHLQADQPSDDLLVDLIPDTAPSLISGKSFLAEPTAVVIPTDPPPASHSSVSSLQPPIQKNVRRSDRTKKPSGRWNEEAGFIPHPPRSSKKKIPEDPRDGNSTLLNTVFSSWSDAQFFKYSNACGVKFLGSPNHKNKCLDNIRLLESARSEIPSSSSGSPSRSDI